MSRAILLGLFYCSIFIGTGVSLPYMPVWFKAHGLNGAQIGLILSGPMLARVGLTPPPALLAPPPPPPLGLRRGGAQKGVRHPERGEGGVEGRRLW